MKTRETLPLHAPTRPESVLQYLAFVEAIRAYAIVNVVLLHVAAPLVVRLHSIDPTSWWIANVADSFARPSVPLFYMVSGLLMLDPAKEESLAQFFRKRFVRVIVPFLAWAAIYFAWRVWFHGESLSWRSAARELIEGPVYVHFWFIYVLLGLYLVAPILRVYVRQASPAQLTYFGGLWIASVSLFPALARFTGIQVGIGLVVTTGFVGYFVLGHALRTVRLVGVESLLALLLMIGLTALTAWGTYEFNRHGETTFDEFFYSNLSPNVIGMSVCSYLVMCSLPYERFADRVPLAHRIVRRIAQTSFAIYLIHMIVLELLGSGVLGFVLNGATLHPLIGIPLATLLIVALSALAAWLLQRLPYVRLIVP